jgi:hypothetical protein
MSKLTYKLDGILEGVFAGIGCFLVIIIIGFFIFYIVSAPPPPASMYSCNSERLAQCQELAKGISAARVFNESRIDELVLLIQSCNYCSALTYEEKEAIASVEKDALNIQEVIKNAQKKGY